MRIISIVLPFAALLPRLLPAQTRLHRYDVVRTGVAAGYALHQFNNRGEMLFMSGNIGLWWHPTTGSAALPVFSPLNSAQPMRWADLNDVGELCGQEATTAGRSWFYVPATAQWQQITGTGGAAVGNVQCMNDSRDIAIYGPGGLLLRLQGTYHTLPPAPFPSVIDIGPVCLGNDGLLLVNPRSATTSYNASLVSPTGWNVLSDGTSAQLDGLDRVPGNAPGNPMVVAQRRIGPNGAGRILVGLQGLQHTYSGGGQRLDTVAADGTIVNELGLESRSFQVALRELIDLPVSVYRGTAEEKINDAHDIAATGAFGGTPTGTGGTIEYSYLRATTLTAALHVGGATVAIANDRYEHTLRWGQTGQFQVLGGEAFGIGAIALVDGLGIVVAAVIGLLDANGVTTIPVSVPAGLTGLVTFKGAVLDSQFGVLQSIATWVRLSP